ncbi:biotin-dependent carboxyltransferase family protein [Microbacterium sp. ZXX196]|uniref:5-oxoprolinase subunit C family protein n=1 Tax=Microbacterium sp. ZXX196 TaxID=2609291 RepID=UPI0012B82BEC|nr:biotin-dependent carboxyltransferase family protein [Microbacterium sp. ZXX196]MTE23335.1 allophanate hydrolase [Microbacterium sp. ZXX196]
MTAGTLRILSAGAAHVTDLGRPTGPRFGVPSGGASDQRAARVANILVGNPDGAPLIETLAFDVEAVADVDALIAVTGANALVEIDGVRRPQGAPISVPRGARIAVLGISGGLRAYLAVRGSFDVPRLLGSCAPDNVLGFGGALAPGSALPLRERTPPLVNGHFGAELFRLPVPRARRRDLVEVTDGPDAAEFAGTAHRLVESPYVVSPTSNHIGLRMTGSLPERRASGEVLSRGVPVGAVEVPPGDEILVLHRGRGVTAGYPVLAVATPAALDVLAQARPGETLRFRRVSDSAAAAQIRAERAALDLLRERTHAALSALGAVPTTPFEGIPQ